MLSLSITLVRSFTTNSLMEDNSLVKVIVILLSWYSQIEVSLGASHAIIIISFPVTPFQDLVFFFVTMKIL